MSKCPRDPLPVAELTAQPDLKRILEVLQGALQLAAAPEALPEDLTSVEGLASFYAQIMDLRLFLLGLSQGKLHQKLGHKGYLPGVLKTFQSNLKHLTWQTQMLADGDFSQRVDFLGEFSTAFNSMAVRLDEAYALTKSILNVIASPIFIKDRAGIYTDCNDAFCTAIGRPKEEIIGKGVFNLFSEEEARKYFEMDEALMVADGVQMYDFRLTRNNGEQRDVIFSKAATHDVAGRVNGIVGVVTDITERNRTARALRESEERYRFLAENSADIIWWIDADHHFIYASPADERMRGFHHKEILGQPVWSAMHPDFVALMQERCRGYLASIADAAEDPAPLRVEVPLLRKDGGSIWVEILSNPVHENDGSIRGFHLVARDVTLRKAYEEQLVFVSTHDALTGLYNRAYFETEFQRTAQGRQLPISVIMADVDGLKNINDSLGHAVGDELIKTAAEVLRKAFRVSDLVARLGGDEFAVLLPGADEAAVAESLKRICTEIGTCGRQNRRFCLSLSLGAATARTPEEMEHLLRKADRCMYEDKTAHKTAMCAVPPSES